MTFLYTALCRGREPNAERRSTKSGHKRNVFSSETGATQNIEVAEYEEEITEALEHIDEVENSMN
jgi:hypothetical protein